MAETRWLSDEEQETWRAFMWMSQLLREALDRQLQRDARMPHAYYLILAMLSEAPGRAMTMSALARTVRFSPSRLSHAVARLEANGWVRRAKQSGDGRTTVAALTDEGFRVLAAAAPGHVHEVRRTLIDVLRPEQVGQLKEISKAALAVLLPAADVDASEEECATG